MANIDTSKRKPRRTAGTPSYYYRNRFAFCAIASGCAIFGLFFFLPTVRELNQKSIHFFSQPSIEFEERKKLFGFAPQKRGEDIFKTIEALEEIDKK